MLNAEKPGDEGLAPSSHRPRVSSSEQQEYLEVTTANDARKTLPRAVNETQLVKVIKVHLAKAEKYQSKAEEHYVTAGQYLMTLKGNSPDQATFLKIVKEQFNLGKSRVYELIQIADGSKTVEEIRASSNERSKASQANAKMSCPLISGQTATDDIPPFLDRTVPDQADQSPWTARGLQKPEEADEKLPTPAKAHKLAAETGRAVQASDGYIYFGTDPEKAREGADRRAMVFGVQRAIAFLATVGKSPADFLDYALPHHFQSFDEEHIEKAKEWLDELASTWAQRRESGWRP